MIMNVIMQTKEHYTVSQMKCAKCLKEVKDGESHDAKICKECFFGKYIMYQHGRTV